MFIDVNSEQEMRELGVRIGSLVRGGEFIELTGDVGAGKTTFTKGFAKGLGITENIQSPSFTISRQYGARDELSLVHYDFYRLNDAGIIKDELRESISDPKKIIVMEWSEIVKDILPEDRLSVLIETVSESTRRLSIEAYGDKSKELARGIFS